MIPTFRRGRWAARCGIALLTLTMTTARRGAAQTVVASTCVGPDEVATALRRIVRESTERAFVRVDVHPMSCSETHCTVHFDVSARSVDCPTYSGPPRSPKDPLRPELGAFECELPRNDCTESEPRETGDAAREPEVAASTRAQVHLTDAFTECVRTAVTLATETIPCPRFEPFSDPVAPPPPPTARGGFDLGLGWHSGSDALQKPLLATGVSLDWSLMSWLTAGARFGYLAAAGNAVDRDGDGLREADARNYHALESAARFRVRLGDVVRRVELEAALGHRLTLGGAVPSHATLGTGATVYFGAFGLGLQYVRALEDVGLDHTVFLTTQRNSPLDVDGRAFSGSRRDRALRVGLGLHAILTGWGFAEHAGPMLPGAAIELPVLLVDPLVAVARYDVLWFPALDAPGFFAQTVLGGLQYWHIDRIPIGMGALVGYAVVDGRTPRVVDGGSVVDGGVWYWLDQLGVHLGLHGRLGLTERNRDLRAVYVSLGARQIF